MLTLARHTSPILLALCAGAACAQPVLITSPVTVGPLDLTITPTGGGAAVPLSTAQITVRAATLTFNGRHTIASLSLENSANLRHSAGHTHDYSGVGTDIVYGASLSVTGDMSIQAASVINISGAGYAGGTGPGLGSIGGGGCGGAGSGYGGPGGRSGCVNLPGGPTYGSATQPTDFGSGGGYYPGFGVGGAGGGALRLIVGGTLSLNGAIVANGLSAPNAAGGSGGSIWITATQLTGSGSLSANGGAEGTSNGSAGGGGGGRIAVTGYCTLAPTITFNVQGGAAPVNQTGGPGTVHTLALTPASIQAGPQGTSACPGELAPFSLTASGDAVAYAWQIETSPGTWTNLTTSPGVLPCGGSASATTPTAAATQIAINPCAGVSTYQVRCVASNPCGSVPSLPATFTIHEPPQITQQPSAAASCPGAPTLFSVAASAVAPFYAWQIETSPGTWANLATTPIALPCGGSASATTPAAPTTQIAVNPCPGVSDYHLRCVVTDVCGVAASDPALLTVNSPPAISQHPASASACVAGSAAFAITASGVNLSYAWQIETSPGTWANLAATPIALPCGGSASATTPAAATTQIAVSTCPGVSHYQVRCAASNVCGTLASNPATYTVCYSNCDCSTSSPTLNVQDFACFLNSFASGGSYANCDASTTPPILNVLDFSCFLNAFAAGCP